MLGWVLGLALATLATFVAIFVTFAVQMSGGWDEVFDSTHPRESDPDVVAARAEGAALADAEIERLVDRVVVPVLAGGRVVRPAAIGPQARDDPALGSSCEIGQHNWKIDDPFDLACVEVRSAVLAGSDGDVRGQLVALDSALIADGCETSHASVLAMTIDYWDRNRGDFPNSPSGDDEYGPEDLPGGWCSTGDGTYSVDVRLTAIDSFTGQPAPEPEDGEFLVMISVSTQSYWA